MCEAVPPAQYQISETDNGGRNGQSLINVKKPPQPEIPNTFESRLVTYRNWPNACLSPFKLAEAGFYYTQHGDVVRCPSCLVEGYRWEADDNPMEDHLNWCREQGRRCHFLNERRSEHDDHQQQQQQQQQQLEDELPQEPRQTDNGAAAERRASSEGTTGVVVGGDTCGKYGVEILPCSMPEDSSVNLEKLGVTKVKGPAHPAYVMQQSRLESFRQWPKSLKQKPEDLASAGFYYLGVGDQTLCFHCGGGLKDWEENDEPWEQHAMWFPKCSYLLMKKGLDYVNKLKEKREPEDLTRPGTSGGAAPNGGDSASSVGGADAEVERSAPKVLCEKKADEKSDSEQDHTLCKICYKNELGVVFLPCGHIVACVDCATALSNCPVCRKPLEATVRAFLS